MFERNFEPQRGSYPFDFENELGNASSFGTYPLPSVYLDDRSYDVFWRPTGWQQSYYTRDWQLPVYDPSLKGAQPIFGPTLDTAPSLYDWPASHIQSTSLGHTPHPFTGNQELIRLSPNSCLGPASSTVSSFDLDHVATSTPLSTLPSGYTIAPTPWDDQLPETLLHYPSQSPVLPCWFRLRTTGGIEARQAQFHSPHRHVYLESSINAGGLVILDWPLEQSEPSLAVVKEHIRPGWRTRRSDVQASCSTPKPESLPEQKEIRGNMDVLDVSLSSPSDYPTSLLIPSPFHTT
jgi:hypothetical protein